VLIISPELRQRMERLQTCLDGIVPGLEQLLDTLCNDEVRSAARTIPPIDPPCQHPGSWARFGVGLPDHLDRKRRPTRQRAPQNTLHAAEADAVALSQHSPCRPRAAVADRVAEDLFAEAVDESPTLMSRMRGGFRAVVGGAVSGPWLVLISASSRPAVLINSRTSGFDKRPLRSTIPSWCAAEHATVRVGAGGASSSTRLKRSSNLDKPASS
jgi:hypothetical protein